MQWFCCCRNFVLILIFCSYLDFDSDLALCNIWASHLNSIIHDMLKNWSKLLLGSRAHISSVKLFVRQGMLGIVSFLSRLGDLFDQGNCTQILLFKMIFFSLLILYESSSLYIWMNLVRSLIYSRLNVLCKCTKSYREKDFDPSLQVLFKRPNLMF